MSTSYYTPLLAQWDITKKCNFKCSFCLSDSGAHGSDGLKWNQASHVLGALHDGGIIYLRLLGGEPLAYRHIDKVFDMAAGYGMLISFSTNGSLITESIAEKLKEIESNINYFQVSLYGVDNRSYRNVTENKTSYQQVSKGIDRLLDVGLSPYLFWVLTSDNINQLQDAYIFANERGIRYLRVSMKLNLGRGSCDKASSIIDKTDWNKAITALQKIKKMQDEGAYTQVQLHARPMLGEYLFKKTRLPYFFITCKAASTMVFVDYDGSCSPCPFSQYMPNEFRNPVMPQGVYNLFDNTLSELWENDVFQEYRYFRDASNNPNHVHIECPHFKSGICSPCIFTPCLCYEEIRQIHRSGVLRQGPEPTLP